MLLVEYVSRQNSRHPQRIESMIHFNRASLRVLMQEINDGNFHNQGVFSTEMLRATTEAMIRLFLQATEDGKLDSQAAIMFVSLQRMFERKEETTIPSSSTPCSHPYPFYFTGACTYADQARASTLRTR